VATIDEMGWTSVVNMGETHLLLVEQQPSGNKVLAIACLKVQRKPLSISGTWVDTIKFFDSNDKAQAAAGKLIGVLAEDVDEVAVEAIARYDNDYWWSDGSSNIVVGYTLSGTKSGRYIPPQSDTVMGRIVNTRSGVCDVWGLVLHQKGEKDSVARYIPWPGADVEYSLDNGEHWGTLKTDSCGRYLLSGLDDGATVLLRAPQKRSYTLLRPTSFPLQVQVKQVVQADTFLYASDGISMLSLSLFEDGGNPLERLENEAIGDTVVYTIPCDENASIQQLSFRYATPPGVTGSLVNVTGIGKGGDEARRSEVEEVSSDNIRVDMQIPGRKVLTIALYNAGTTATKLYTIVLEKKFELFYIIREHLGSLRVVHNNPEKNDHGLEFSSCDWYRWDSSISSWVVKRNLLYYTISSNISDKFTNSDSMYIRLLTTDNVRLETCPAVGKDPAYVEDGDIASDSKKSATVSIYPNPVAAGGVIRLKQTELVDNEQELYTTLYLFDAQGRLVLTDNASTLSDGLTMPETPGIYHLVLEGKAGRKVIKVAVGQKM
jgi:hypothetical protein